MIAIDTNVLVRLLTRDNEAQYKTSHKLFSSEEIFIADTVILETEWVLRYAYELNPEEICNAFRMVFGLKNVSLNNGRLVEQIIAWHEAGLDFADAWHLALSQNNECLKTFDEQFIKRSKKLCDFPVKKP